jgi:hypothetical protein
MIQLTNDQKKSLKLLNDYGEAMLSSRDMKSMVMGKGEWIIDYYEYGCYAWSISPSSAVTYKPGLGGCKDSFYTKPKQVPMKVSGELQNKGLVTVYISSTHGSIFLRLTELGQLTAMQLRAEETNNTPDLQEEPALPTNTNKYLSGKAGDNKAWDLS